MRNANKSCVLPPTVLQKGFECVSMSGIAARVGGSKATLYNYFQNKQDLFVEVIVNSVCQMVDDASMTLDQSLPLCNKLRVLGIRYLVYILSDDSIALRRNVFVYSHQGKVGREIYNRFMRHAWGHVADLIESSMAEGILRKADSWFATMQLKGLFESDLVDRRMLDCDKAIGDQEIEKSVDVGLAVFCSYYRKKSRSE